ncbi:hypothetical protein [Caldimonas tepidiphila]|uniref:hypothetical protein n=1 Tax=Caldimonas tepidiphila TaxID=2315841 RepID=UPI000E5B867D|nr:hypothetical protein [Caldimonas tepidiphila]
MKLPRLPALRLPALRLPAPRPVPVPGVVPLRRPASEALTIESAYVWYCMAMIWLGLIVNPFKLFYYAIPAIGVVVCLALRRFALPEITWPFLVLMAVGVATAPLATLAGWQDLYLMLIGVMPFALGSRYPVTWWRVFVFALLGTGLMIAIGRSSLGEVRIDFMNSESTFESPFCFVFGMLAIWAGLTRRWKELLLAIVITVFTLKRIALIGVVLTLVLIMMPRRLADLLLRPLPMVLFNAAAVWLAVLYTRGEFDFLIHQYLGQSANQAGMGRQALYGFVVDELTAHLGRYAVLGGGAGWAYELMKGGYDWQGKANLHADVMKILVEYGGIAFVAFFWMAYRSRSLTLRFFWFYANVTLLTDNTLIYPFFIFALCLSAQAARRELDAASAGAPPARLPPRTRPPLAARPWTPPA